MSTTADLSDRLQLHAFPDAEALAAALAGDVAARLRAALGARGEAVLALSGGNTPKRFLQQLSRQPLDWDRVVVTLVDERWVPDDHDRSNARLVNQVLLQGPAAAARLVPLYRPLPMPEQALAEVERDLPATIDVAVLGMGADGHTASFFPKGDQLAQALDPAGRPRVLPMHAPAAGEPRITLTLSALLAAGHLLLHIEGEDKRAVLDAALAAEGDARQLPVRAVFEYAGAVAVYYCP